MKAQQHVQIQKRAKTSAKKEGKESQYSHKALTVVRLQQVFSGIEDVGDA